MYVHCTRNRQETQDYIVYKLSGLYCYFYIFYFNINLTCTTHD